MRNISLTFSLKNEPYIYTVGIGVLMPTAVNTTLLPSVNSAALGVFCGARSTSHSCLHKTLNYSNNKHLGKMSLINT